MFSLLKVLSVLLLLVPALHAQTAVHTDGPTRTVALTVGAGTLDSIHVFTQGSEKYDLRWRRGGPARWGRAILRDRPAR